jgi:hypothetical protein
MFILTLTNANTVIDSLSFGNQLSEQQHLVKAELGEIVDGEFGLSARRLLPSPEKGWRGGRVTFSVKVDPDKPNYFTAKFWGGDVNDEETRLMLFIDGKQVGQRHLGEIDQLDIMCSYPRNPGNFFYKTFPLPENMTSGKNSVELAIEAQGPVWGYGSTFDKFQKPMTEASRGIYAAYIHTDPYLKLQHVTKNNIDWDDLSTPDSPGIEVLDSIKEKINKAIQTYLDGRDKIGADVLMFLAKAYFVDWSTAYNNAEVLDKIVKAINIHYAEFKSDPEIVGETWEGYGGIGEVISLLAKPLEPYFQKTIEGANISYKEAWGEMLQASRDWHVQNRRSYTNQSMIVDLYTYRCNRGLAVVAPDKAWPEKTALRLLYESIGLEPWSGSWDENLKPSWSKGKNFIQLTDNGLTKELGFVGLYGEVNDIVLGMYNSTRPTPGAEGDAKLKSQLIKIAKARTIFRYPVVNEEGERTMRIETVIGWRDWHYPGSVAYDQIASRDGGPLEIAAATLDPVMLGYGQQIIADKQYFKTLKERAKGNRPSELLSLMDAPQSYHKVIEQREQNYKLPMTPGQPDFVFADPEEGVVALKNGDQILYVSLYWRARYAINNLARVHYLGPDFEYDATVNIHTEFNSSEYTYTMPDLTNAPFSAKLEKGYKDAGMYLAVAGQKQPIAKVPDDQEDFKPGHENMYAGKGNFYIMQYGSYLIAMNCTKDKSYPLEIPAKFKGTKNLVDDKKVELSQITVKPMQTVVLYAK